MLNGIILKEDEVIEAIANAIASTDGCNLLDVDPGMSTNRTVYTFVGTPEAVVEGALNGARAASQLIDMTRHHGEHPRLGAMDVCPFIPVKNVTMEDCVECAKEFAERLAVELGIPVYLYGEAAAEDYRRTVPQIRSGEYEGLSEKLAKPEWKPDFGAPDFVASWGATIVGARKFLIAYNINMLSTKEQAHRVALNIREQGRGENEDCIWEDREVSDEPGRLKNIQAIGWYLEEANLAQVSVNITDYELTPIHVVYEEVCNDATDLSLGVVGSQIVGLVPLNAILKTAEYFMEKESLFLLEEDQKIRLVVDRLGLHSLGGFNPKERIIEYMVESDKDGPLLTMDLKEFILTVGARSPTPGGGSVAALTATLGAALGAMTGFLTYGNKKFYSLDKEMRQLLSPLYKTTRELMPFIDADAAAFSDLMLASKLPKNTEDEKTFHDKAVQRAVKNAIAVPMTMAQTANSLWPSMKELAKIGNISCKSDLQVGAKSLETGVWGAYQNVLINLGQVTDEEAKKTIQQDAEKELKTATENCADVLRILEERK
ncbi:hypothetical protein LSH36_66g07035 [Paralvinella palmiformis]|uniref:Formimidoyltransferase-cyclodeaminase n=1 Tax=Paralvinella palmiformis TaxID=53620 RepID=A0AAD9NDI9_9ANNE|nr:hypothetical protein LSH36_66g07035 [Paralvinella palmiformis]